MTPSCFPSFVSYPVCWLTWWLSGKESACNAGDIGIRISVSLPGWRKSYRGGNGTTAQYSCLGIPTDRGAWWVTIGVVAKELDTTEATEQRAKCSLIKFSLGEFLLLLHM